MKICILGDIHWGFRNASDYYLQHQIEFFDEVFFPYLLENKIDTVIQLGDLFDNRKFINIKILHHAKKHFFAKFDEYGIMMHTILGNHDTVNKNSNDINSISTLLDTTYKNIDIITEPKEIVFDKVRCLFVPWINKENQEDIAKSIKSSTADLLFGHFEINGFPLVRGVDCIDGMKPELLKHFDMIMSGHFHSQTQIGNIHYIGTPYQMDWNDHGETKGFHIIDTDMGTSEFINNPNVTFHKIDYNNTVIDDFEQYRNAIVKVLVIEKSDDLQYQQFLDKLDAVAYEMKIIDLEGLDEDQSIEEINLENPFTVLINVVDKMERVKDKQSMKLKIREIFKEAQELEMM